MNLSFELKLTSVNWEQSTVSWHDMSLRVWLAKNHTLCHAGKIFFSGNWVGALWLGPPRPKNPLPPPPRACGGRFPISGLRNPVLWRFSFFIFPYIFRNICQGIHLNLLDSVQKKFWHLFFWTFLTFYLVKWNPLGPTRRVQKLKTPHLIFHIQYQNLNQNFIVFLLIPFIDWPIN